MEPGDRRNCLRRLTSLFAAGIAASSLVGLSAATGLANGRPTSPANDAGQSQGHGSTTGPGAGNVATPGHTGHGDDNHGDVWLQTVGPCPDHNAEVLNHDPGGMACTGDSDTVAEQNLEIGSTENTLPDHNPHLPCANIEVMGKDMADASGNYRIDYWPPTGNKGGVYGKNSNGSSALSMVPPMTNSAVVGHNGTWGFSAAKGGYQVMDIIDVGVLVANAQAINPDPHDIQGYHFKLQYTQDPQKHKTFWVKCAPPTPPPPATDCDNDRDGSKATDTDCGSTPPIDCDNDKDGSRTTDADCGSSPPADCDNDHDGSAPADSDCSSAPPVTDCDHDLDASGATDADCKPGGGTGPGGTTPGGGITGVHGASTTAPASGVLGATTNNPVAGVLGAMATNPITGHPLLSAAILAALLTVIGGGMLTVNVRRRSASA